MVKIEGKPIDDAGFRPDRAQVCGEILHAAAGAADRRALPFVQEIWEMGGVW